ncbi:MAG TPA: serine hydrolase domain-containing protein [Planctomycetaceae bacterium]|jgi:CubicO group peptidase (beta-lactamase class C family)|nr:serine hydrolase domain-containing protein [Planctomycetaceae bacterium]
MKHTAIQLFVCAPLLCLLSQPAIADDSLRTQITPERIQSALHKVEDLANETLRTGIPGIAIAVVHHDQVVYIRGFGVREAGHPERIDADTVFQLASVSKPITSTVLAALVGEGRIGWDDRVIDHDHSFRMFDPFVTRELRLRDLLCHRSGLPDHWGDLIEDLGYGRDEVLRRARFQPPASSFRAQYAYTLATARQRMPRRRPAGSRGRIWRPPNCSGLWA